MPGLASSININCSASDGTHKAICRIVSPKNRSGGGAENVIRAGKIKDERATALPQGITERKKPLIKRRNSSRRILRMRIFRLRLRHVFTAAGWFPPLTVVAALLCVRTNCLLEVCQINDSRLYHDKYMHYCSCGWGDLPAGSSPFAYQPRPLTTYSPAQSAAL